MTRRWVAELEYSQRLHFHAVEGSTQSHRHLFSPVLPAAVVLLGGCQSAKGQTWNEFAPEGQGFSVSLPGIPTRESLESQNRLGAMNGHRFTLQQEGEKLSYRIEYFD